MCNRLSFLYGTPYYHRNLIPQIHEGQIHEGKTVKPLLPECFGAIPLDMFIHAARNVRRGEATVYERSRASAGKRIVTDDALRAFADLQKVTLITGDLNQLWHRDSIDRMHEWLSRRLPRQQLVKHVLPGYGHQDLLWGEHAKEEVYKRVGEGLTLDHRPIARRARTLPPGCTEAA
jgi:hypothetical protein